MSAGNGLLMGLIGLIALNALIPRTQLGRRFPAFFWTVQGVNLAAGLAVLVIGAPGFEHMPIVRLVVGLLVVLHLAQNFHSKVQWNGLDRAERLEAELESRRASED